MLKTILHQLLNQRRMNGWIFFELLLVSLFLWMVIDPICVLKSVQNMPHGYESEGRYVVRLQTLDATYAAFNPEYEDDSLRVNYYEHIARLLRDLPEVDSYAVSVQLSFPGSGNWSGGTLYGDTLAVKGDKFVHGQWYAFVDFEGSDPFKTYGFRDAATGAYLQKPADTRNKLFLSENYAQALCGTAQATGKYVYMGDQSKHEVAGVFANYKHFEQTEYYPLYIQFEQEIKASPYMVWRYPFILKLKEGVDATAFEQRFAKEVAPLLSMGNLRFASLKSFDSYVEDNKEMSGTNNLFRLKYALTGFAVLCIFLGMLGTFWIRSNARRQEIGVMRSMGASRQTITLQFLLEAGLLVTLAFLCALVFILIYGHLEGFTPVPSAGNHPLRDPDFWANNFTGHFFAVSMVAYIILLVTSLLGTYIPVRRAANVLPADALRDE